VERSGGPGGVRRVHGDLRDRCGGAVAGGRAASGAGGADGRSAAGSVAVAEHPEVDLSVQSSVELVDFDREAVDAAIVGRATVGRPPLDAGW
jgi:hypothetical protein